MARSSSADVRVRARDGVAGFAGLQHCGSVWACPVCSAQILTERALDIGSVLGQAVAEGYQLGFVTLTMRHRRQQALTGLWDAAGAGWRRAISGRGWVEAQELHGVVGWVRVWEVTHGRNGWHVHVHLVLVLDGDATGATLDKVAGGMFDRWSKGLVDAGVEAPRRAGQEWHLAAGDEAASQLGEYLFKVAELAAEGEGHQADRARALGLELTHTRPGRARDDLRTRPVWSLLDDVIELGDADALRLWHEWEAGSKGRRQVGWSKGLRERFAPEVEDATDEEIANRDLGSPADDLAVITLAGWRKLVRSPDLCCAVLEAAELEGRAGVATLLCELGVEHRLLGPPD